MNVHADKTQENKSQAVSNGNSKVQSSGESTFQFVDNRPEAIAQRKLNGMANNYSVRQKQPIQKKGNNTGLPGNLKTGIENLSGYSMDDVKVHYNSGKPAQLQAHAYAQGTNIHLGPGQEKHLPHEAWHVVQQKQGRVNPTMQMKGGVNVNDESGLENEADIMGAKANATGQLKEKTSDSVSINANKTGSTSQLKKNNNQNEVVQRVKSVVVGESHGTSKINIKRETKIISTNPGVGWTKKAEPSKLAAALIQHNGFTPIANYKTELERQMQINGGLKNVMTTAENISNGNDESWGAEDNVIGYRSSAKVSDAVAPKDSRTHIENPQVRNDASFLRTLSSISGHAIPVATVTAGYPNKSGYQILQAMGVSSAESELSSVSPAIKDKWTALKKANGLFGVVVNHISPLITVTNELGVTSPAIIATQERWEKQTIFNIEKGLNELLEVSVTEICKLLGDEFSDPLKSPNPGIQLVKDIANLRYGNEASVMSRMHAAASIARTITQLGGMSSNNKTYEDANPTVTNLKTGYIVGDNHLEDFEKIKSAHTKNDKLKSMIDNTTIVRRSKYGDLKQSAKDAVKSTKRTATLKVT